MLDLLKSTYDLDGNINEIIDAVYRPLSVEPMVEGSAQNRRWMIPMLEFWMSFIREGPRGGGIKTGVVGMLGVSIV